jgi:hypothetical protein
MKYVIFCFIFALAFSCSKNGIPRISESELSSYKIVKDTVYREGKKIAYLNLIEWEYHKGELLREISLVQFDRTEQGETLKLIAYMRKMHPKSKIEVKFREDN